MCIYIYDFGFGVRGVRVDGAVQPKPERGHRVAVHRCNVPAFVCRVEGLGFGVSKSPSTAATCLQHQVAINRHRIAAPSRNQPLRHACFRVEGFGFAALVAESPSIAATESPSTAAICLLSCLVFGVWCLGLKVQGLGFRASGSQTFVMPNSRLTGRVGS